MSCATSVTVICPNKRRCVIKITPSISLNEILEESCKKEGFNADEFTLKHQNRPLRDLSLSFRLSGLANNATLEMAAITGELEVDESSRALSEVDIGLQISDGSRKTRKFPPNASLFDVISAFSQEDYFNFDLINVEAGTVPSCAYMNKQWIGADELNLTTLKSVGINRGKALLRYSAIKINAEGLAAIQKRLDAQREKETRLEGLYWKRRAENEKRGQIEHQRDLQYERERLECEQRMENKAQKVPSQNEAATKMSEDITNQSPTTDTSTLASTRLNRLARLEEACQVNQSLTSEDIYNDFIEEDIRNDLIIVNQWLTESGSIDLSSTSVLMTTNSNRESSPEQNVPLELAAKLIPTAAELMNESTTTIIPACDRLAIVFTIVKQQTIDSTNEKKEENLQLNGEKDVNAEEENERFYEPTADDLRRMQRMLADEAKSHVDRALIPKAVIERANLDRKQSAWKHSVLRFMIGEGRVLQACFVSSEPALAVYDFIKSAVTNKDFKFELTLPPNILVKTNAKSLLESSLAPSSTLVVKQKTTTADSSNREIILKEDVVTSGTLDAANEIAKDWLSSNETFIPYRPSIDSNNENVSLSSLRRQRNGNNFDQSSPSPGSRPSRPKMPKWFQKN